MLRTALRGYSLSGRSSSAAATLIAPASAFLRQQWEPRGARVTARYSMRVSGVSCLFFVSSAQRPQVDVAPGAVLLRSTRPQRRDSWSDAASGRLVVSHARHAR